MNVRGTLGNPRAAILSYFGALADLAPGDEEVLRLLAARLTPQPAGAELTAADAPLEQPLLLASGWVCRAATLADGRRQILDFYLPGDLIGFSIRPGARAVAPYLALTRVETAPATELLRLVREEPPSHPGLAEAARVLTQQIEIRMLQQIIRNGRQTAYERVGHLLLEFHGRLKLSGQTRDGSFALPLTQEVLADAVGLSTVHMNRTMQQLRKSGLIRTEDGLLTILDPERLAVVAGRHGRTAQPRALQTEAWAAQGR